MQAAIESQHRTILVKNKISKFEYYNIKNENTKVWEFNLLMILGIFLVQKYDMKRKIQKRLKPLIKMILNLTLA